MKVCVIGGGVAGLYACHNLKKLGIDFVLLESSDRLGGRVQQQEINGVNIEIGAEFIHGSCSILNHLLKKLKMSYRPTFDWTSPESKESLGYFFNGKLHKTTEVQELLDIFDKMTEVYPESNMTLFEFLENEKFNKNLFGIADCFYGKTFNSNIKELGLYESGKQERLWPYSGQNFKLNDSYAPLLKYLSKDLNPVFNFKVTKISHQQSDKIVVFGEKNQFVTCDKLLVTVPLSILKEIDFYPQLPTKKQNAIEKLGFGQAMKTIISFNKKFWNQRNLIFTDDPCINQIWMMANTKDEFFVTAFTVAESVGNYKKIKNPEKYFVDLLDKIFENQASKYFVRLVEQYDWTTNEFIKGGYSNTKMGSFNCSNHLFENIDERIFFAGEACSIDSVATVNGALESSERAIHKIFEQKSKI